jgi:hypothetical protein
MVDDICAVLNWGAVTIHMSLSAELPRQIGEVVKRHKVHA